MENHSDYPTQDKRAPFVE
jgi:DNA-binding NarL/FixJ family response regulator